MSAAAAHSVPTGAAFDIVLLLHVAAVLVGLVTVVVSAVMAARVLAADGEAPPSSAVGYFAPGVNWAGRVLYAVPLLGLGLLAMSNGAYSISDRWVEWGLGLWVVAAVVAEGLLWPAEQRVRATLGEEDLGAAERARLRRACRTVCWCAAALVVVLVAAVVVMVAQP